MMEFKAHDYPEIYEDLGIDLRTLGCVMLKTEQPDTSFIKDKDLYASPDEKKFWVNGRVAGDSHVTLKYGLLPSVRQEHARRILDDVHLPLALRVTDLQCFDSPYEDEPYECIVARVEAATAMNSGHTLGLVNSVLGLLPNVNTFAEYKPHVTLAYVKKGWWLKNYNEAYRAVRNLPNLRTKGLDFGRMAP